MDWRTSQAVLQHQLKFRLFAFQLVRRIYKGIPLQLRGEVWCLLLEINKIKEEKKDFYEVRWSSPTSRHVDQTPPILVSFSDLDILQQRNSMRRA